MGLTRQFDNKKIFLDTAPLIYYIEENPLYEAFLNDLFSSHEKKKRQFVSSVITLIEVLVLPIREGNKALSEAYEKILSNSRSIDIFDINTNIAKIAAQLRADYSLKTPDAIQLATAIYTSADFFLTNDKRLQMVKEVKVITLNDIQ